MHSCRRIESRLVELLFDDVEVEERRRLLAEIEGCASCAGQYGSLSDTLVVVERATAAAAAALPPESYWPHYNAALRSRLQTPQPVTAGAETKARPHIFQRLLRAELRIPLPVAAALFVCLIISSALAFRPTRVAPSRDAANVSPVESIRVVEVPVIKEKTVTRIVYVEKKRQPSRALAPLVARAPEMPDLVIARNKPEEETGFFTRANLKGFQPADEMKIRVLKRNDANEK
jgi:hypothetical protein